MSKGSMIMYDVRWKMRDELKYTICITIESDGSTVSKASEQAGVPIEG